MNNPGVGTVPAHLTWMVKFCFREVSELLSAHRLIHAFRAPPKGRFTAAVTSGNQTPVQGHSLFIGFCNHSEGKERNTVAISFR